MFPEPLAAIVTPMMDMWNDDSASEELRTALEAARKAVSQSAPAWVWDSVIMSILNLPTFVLFGLLAIFSGYFGRHRHQLKVHIN